MGMASDLRAVFLADAELHCRDSAKARDVPTCRQRWHRVVGCMLIGLLLVCAVHVHYCVFVVVHC